MAYDQALAERIRVVLESEDVRELKMFGGLSFLINDKMVVTANTHGDLMVRCDPAQTEELLGRPAALAAEMGERTMSPGWIRVTDDGIGEDADLAFWIETALAYNRRVAGARRPD